MREKSPQALLDALRSQDFHRGQLVWSEVRAAREARYATLPTGLFCSRIMAWMGKHMGERAYTHQVAAWEMLSRGQNVVVNTEPGSGKSLVYQLPILEGLLERGENALLLFPTKALAHDQCLRFNALLKQMGSTQRAYTLDGDTQKLLRKEARLKGSLILSNLDMLHYSMLPAHARWGGFFMGLRWVVLDEVHVYGGIFGSHALRVLERLSRVMRHYRAEAHFLACSATHDNAREHVSLLTGRHFACVDRDGSPRGEQHFALWDSRKQGDGNSNEDARRILALFLERGARCVVFAKSWIAAELLAKYLRESLPAARARGLGVFRGGYTPEVRERLQERVFSGELQCLITVLGVDLGVDLKHYDACLIHGYPGSIAELKQQAGRVGRDGRDSLVLMVGHDTPVNQYLVKHPRYLLTKHPEPVQLYPGNPYIRSQHLNCAARELPLTGDETARASDILPLLVEEKVLASRDGRYFSRSVGNPALKVKLRGKSEVDVEAMDVKSGKVIASVDEFGAYAVFHPGAVYLSGERMYRCIELDLAERKMAFLEPVELDHYTYPLDAQAVHSLSTVEATTVVAAGEFGFGEGIIRFGMEHYLEVELWTKRIRGMKGVSLPYIEYPSSVLWLEPSDRAVSAVIDAGRNPRNAKKGLESALAKVVGHSSHASPSDLGLGGGTFEGEIRKHPYTAYVFDNYRGGLGFCERAFETGEALLRATHALIQDCPCEEGCPSCVASLLSPIVDYDPSVYEGLLPDKEGALCFLSYALGKPKRPRVLMGAKQAWRGRAWAPRGAGEQRHVVRVMSDG